MICKRSNSSDRLPFRSKRLFLFLLTSSAFLTYILYGNVHRSSHTVKFTPFNGLKNENNHSILTRVRSGATKRPLRQSNHLEHVAFGVSSDFKTKLNPTRTSDKLRKFSSKLFQERIKHRSPEDSASRSRLNSRIKYTSNVSGVDKSLNYSSSRGDRKRLLNFRSQSGRIEDSEDSDVSEFELEDDEFKKRLPNAIIIGVKKGGTRALLEILKIHPSIRACSSEVHFFDRDENYEQGLSWYREQMPKSLPEQITIEKSPSYFITSKVPERVYRMSETIKLIVIVRDPTTRAISDYTQGLERKPDNPRFEEMVFNEEGEVDESWSKISISRYAEHLAKWMEYFPLRQFHFVSGEELVKRPAKELKLVERFLNIKPFIREDNFYFNESKGFPCFVGKISNAGNVNKAHCMGESKGRKHPAVHEDVLLKLRGYFDPLNKKLYSMVHRNFHW